MSRALRVGMRCDAGGTLGVGHVARCIALADALVQRDAEVVFLSDLGSATVLEGQLAARGILVEAPAHDPAGIAAQAGRLGFAAAVLDGYHLDPGLGDALGAAGLRTLALHDGEFGARQSADLYLDQNLGSEEVEGPTLAAGSRRLAGLRYVLLRDEVLARRPPRPRTPSTDAPLRILGVFGGTDPRGAAVVVAPLLRNTGMPFSATFVASRPETVPILRALPLRDGQTLEVRPPVQDLAGLADGADLVVTAAGSSMWEMLTLGLPTAAVCVSDNQLATYQRLIAGDLTVGLGLLDDLEHDGEARSAAQMGLRRLLGEAPLRSELGARGWHRIDGRGRERVVDALLEGLPGTSA